MIYRYKKEFNMERLNDLVGAEGVFVSSTDIVVEVDYPPESKEDLDAAMQSWGYVYDPT